MALRLRIKSGVAQQEGESTSGTRGNRFNPLVKKVRIYTVGLEIRLSVDGNSSAGLWWNFQLPVCIFAIFLLERSEI